MATSQHLILNNCIQHKAYNISKLINHYLLLSPNLQGQESISDRIENHYTENV